MDLGFFRRGQQGFDSRTPAPLDYQLLRAAIGSVQASSAAARANAGAASARSFPAPRDPLVEILLATTRWQDAVPAQGGSFNRERAGNLSTPCKLK